MEADDKYTRLSSLRDYLIGVLALLGGALWLSAVWPKRFAILGSPSFWLFGAGALATLFVTARAVAWARRRDQLMGLEKQG